MKKQEEDKKAKFWENMKFVAVGALVVAMLAGSALLFWQIQKQNQPVKVSSDQSEVKKQIDDLNTQIASLNQAVKDAQKVETSESTVKTTTKSEGTVAGASTESSTEVSGIININSASLEELDVLPGIGPAYAQKIIDYREANGGFKTIDEIQNVKGIGPKTFEKMKDQITV